MPSIVALIPARAGSKRVPNKNTRPLAGKTLLLYTIEAANASGIFNDILVSSDDVVALDLARRAGVVALSRSSALAGDDSPDIEWVRHAIQPFSPYTDAFAILRPTSPFRTPETIQRAWRQFQADQPCDSLRAVQPVREHPYKMWRLNGDGTIAPILIQSVRGVPAHSCPTHTLPLTYVQNASLEIAWTRVVKDTGTISGTRIRPFFTDGLEGFDINTEDDWGEAERLISLTHA